MIKGFELADMNKMVVQESLRVGLSQSKFAVLHVHNLHVNAFL